MNRTVEVFAGAYASGKSETSLNRARHLVEKGEQIILVDLDSVEPAYTLRPIANDLEKMGIKVITQPDNFGLGEAASYVTPAQINCLNNKGNIIIDVGYGAGGLDILDIITNIEQEKKLFIYLVVNTAKFETSTVENIIEYVTFSEGINKKPWKKFSGFISNTHFGDKTTKEDIIYGYEKLKKASNELRIPIKAIGIPDNLSNEFESIFDNTEVWVYKRLMPKAFW